MDKNGLLLFMLICYAMPIYYVYSNYVSNHSVSNIICDDTCKYHILFFMFLMGIGTLLYEMKRNDTYSTLFIGILLIGIYGLLFMNESHTIHYFFAFLVFLSILLFMIRHCYVTGCDMILSSSLVVAMITLLCIIVQMNKNIFYGEIIYLLNFAFFYLYLHFIPVSNMCPITKERI
jgi:hypothetical protein